MVEVGQLEPSVRKIVETLFLNGPTCLFFGLTNLRFLLFFKSRFHRFGLCFHGFYAPFAQMGFRMMPANPKQNNTPAALRSPPRESSDNLPMTAFGRDFLVSFHVSFLDSFAASHHFFTIHLPPLSPPSRTSEPTSFIARMARQTLFAEKPNPFATLEISASGVSAKA